MDDMALLLKAIALNPGEDSPRLILADWLDENVGMVKCPDCENESGYRIYCKTCEHSGRVGMVPDGRRERAEFIRVQMHLHQNRPGNPARDETNLYVFMHRESALLTAHESDWRRAGVCPACDGTCTDEVETVNAGKVKRAPCPHCWGGDVGGLLQRVGERWREEEYARSSSTDFLHRVDFQRGFPHRVRCSLDDVCVRHDVCPGCRGRGGWKDPEEGQWVTCKCDKNNPWQPTPWALAVCRYHPVTEFRVDVPFGVSLINSWWPHDLPAFLWELTGSVHDQSTPDAAHTAMALALGGWVRGFVKEGAA